MSDATISQRALALHRHHTLADLTEMFSKAESFWVAEDEAAERRKKEFAGSQWTETEFQRLNFGPELP